MCGFAWCKCYKRDLHLHLRVRKKKKQSSGFRFENCMNFFFLLLLFMHVYITSLSGTYVYVRQRKTGTISFTDAQVQWVYDVDMRQNVQISWAFLSICSARISDVFTHFAVIWLKKKLQKMNRELMAAKHILTKVICIEFGQIKWIISAMNEWSVWNEQNKSHRLKPTALIRIEWVQNGCEW